jgi:hypothetical protein
MRLLIATVLLFSTASYAATVQTPAGKIDLPPQPSEQYIQPTLKPTADPDVSWGKAGVSFADYRMDKLYCTSYGVVHALNAPAWALSKNNDLWDYINMDYPSSGFRHLGQQAIEHCLNLRGYGKFRLTQDEVSHLSSLKAGSVERIQYLYALASDASVLNSRKF